MTQTISYYNINQYIYEYLSYVLEKEEIIKSYLMDDDWNKRKTHGNGISN